jgi:hypothetical protein
MNHLSREFIKPLKEPSNGAEFDDLDAGTKKDYELLDYAQDDVNPMKDLWNNKGYQPYEPIKGFIHSSKDVSIIKPEHRLNIQRRGYYGQCTDLAYMAFMDSLET